MRERKRQRIERGTGGFERERGRWREKERDRGERDRGERGGDYGI